MENPVETLLKNKGPRGLSIRQLSYLMGVDKRRVRYHIYHSTNVADTEPILHGSLKAKINVYSYTPDTKKYYLRKIKEKRKKNEVETEVEVV